jgi:predicted RNA-binding protein YlxR (DUF448 family)
MTATATFWDELTEALGAVPLMLPEDALLMMAARLDDGRGLWPHLQREIIADPTKRELLDRALAIAYGPATP